MRFTIIAVNGEEALVGCMFGLSLGVFSVNIRTHQAKPIVLTCLFNRKVSP